MELPSLAALIPVLQVAIGPVILISGVGLLLLSMTNRLGRAIDRARILREEIRSKSSVDEQNIKEQLNILWHRADIIRKAGTTQYIMAPGRYYSKGDYVCCNQCTSGCLANHCLIYRLVVRS
jgi:hypothetical protein